MILVSVKVDWLNKFIELMWPYLDKVMHTYYNSFRIFSRGVLLG